MDAIFSTLGMKTEVSTFFMFIAISK